MKGLCVTERGVCFRGECVDRDRGTSRGSVLATRHGEDEVVRERGLEERGNDDSMEMKYLREGVWVRENGLKDERKKREREKQKRKERTPD
jgi:hypothetical protein